MKTFLTRSVVKKARKLKIDRSILADAVRKANNGLIDAELGANLCKLRIGRKGDYRTVLILVRNQKCILLELFAKSAQATIKGQELETLRDFAKIVANLSDDQFIELAKRSGWETLSDEPSEEVL